MSSQGENYSGAPGAAERRQRHLIAATAALLAGVVTALLGRASASLGMEEAASAGGASLGVLMAGALPGAAVGAVCWAVIVGLTCRYAAGRPGANSTLWHSFLLLPTTVLAGRGGALGTYALCRLLYEYTHLEPLVDVCRTGAQHLTIIGFVAGCTAALFAHMGIILCHLQRTMRDTRAELEDAGRASQQGDAQ